MDYYNSIAQGYEELYGEEQLNKLRIIKRNIIISRNTTILDVGCGTGISSSFGCFVAGIDPSDKLLRRNNNPLRVIGIAESLPFKDGSFDYVISVTSMHNFNDMHRSISEIKRVGRKNFIFSILRKSADFEAIARIIGDNFKVNEIIEEDKDLIFFCGKP